MGARAQLFDDFYNSEIIDLEFQLLLEALYKCYQIDFKDYSMETLKRRVYKFIVDHDFLTISHLQSKILRDEDLKEKLLNTLLINVTEMFRDPICFYTIRKKVIPHLKTFPKIKIWHAGCSTGEEVVSMNILLQEAGLLDRSTVYATDLDSDVFGTAKKGIYSLDKIKLYTQNYINSGGSHEFSKYYKVNYGHAQFNSELVDNVLYEKHNLVTDGSIGEFNLVFCRNVMIYFNKSLKNKALNLINDSLCLNGSLVLGRGESIFFSPIQNYFTPVSRTQRIYLKDK